jgi:hypothetical protein
MATNVNVWRTNWQATGANVPVPQYTMNLRLEWVNAQGEQKAWQGTATFPNDLQHVPTAWLREHLEHLVLEVARKRLGVDD